MGAQLVAARAAGRLPTPGLPPQTEARAVWVGCGESYAVWRLEAGGVSLSARLPFRPPEQMPRPMAAEFAALRLVPEKVGTRGLALADDDHNPFGQRYLLTTWTPGRVKPVERWGATDFERLAVQLARLHALRRPQAGLVDQPITPDRVNQPTVIAPNPVNQPVPAAPDLVADFDASLAWWRDHHPAALAQPEWSRLAQLTRRFVAARAEAGGRPRQFSLIHGDLEATNVVFAADDWPRLIDWEWAEYGDPARDLAYVGGRAAAGPWYVPMDQTQIVAFVTSYVRAAAARGVDHDLDRLLARRDAWEAYNHFFCGLHRDQRQAAQPQTYPEADLRALRQGLARLVAGA